uniref:Uncharacterized protein n=1 Tax=Mucochytrium quahogii TaxID=96639 RepID=A0A7S2WGQ8_9STRA|mmetsp:Transcript_5870/g.10265  ORF Transcript_5870/g.10265 Transcript_5870/m.10265 type:complete len:846 (-) Transcript_5870:625-3162(-)|eukprot:CAMPEP_0203761840 /NCGR_PEP_ID=MMETSP0098-20131031/14847_1 /ASSEMBLY_ACC=CAM_ASM_000208 /TAXON_ID=96639 /ORGANISM=" , Strain NY0313808BC1" /LENGTH=845 /DNA_ID=CAMNT_0050655997 /DNA_START=212 /DNA_END=2749 /DNA_ORIENTATION=-
MRRRKSTIRARSSSVLTPKDAIQRTVTGPSRSVGLGDYLAFWSDLTVQNVTDLFCEITLKIIEMDRPERKNSSRGAQTNSKKEHALFALAYTLDYIHLFLAVDSKSKQFEKAKKAWDGHLKSHHPVVEKCNKIMRNVVLRASQPGNHLIAYSLVDCTYVVQDERGLIASDFPFDFVYIRYFAENFDKDVAYELYGIFEKNLVGLLKAAERQPYQCVPGLMNLLHVFCEILIILPVITNVVGRVQNIAHMVKSDLLLWPKPYCVFADRMIAIAERELENPGYLLRQRVVKEFPGLQDPSKGENEVLGLFGSFTRQEKVTGEVCANLSFAHLQKRVSHRRLLLHFLKIGISYDDQVESDIDSLVKRASPEDISRWVTALLACDGFPESMSKRYEILGEIDISLQQKARRNGFTGLNFPYQVNTPICEFRFESFDGSLLLGEPDEQSRFPDYGIELGDTKRIMCIGGNIAVHKLLCAYMSVIRSLGKRADAERYEIFLVPVGRNDLCSFIAMRDGWYRKHIYSPYSVGLHMSPPISDAMTKDPRKVSAYSSNSSSSNINLEEGTVSPMRRQFEILSDYVQSASQTCKAQIYQCSCWTDSDQAEPSIVIPFTTRVEIGLNASVNRFINHDEIRNRDRSVSNSSMSSTTSSASSLFFLNSSQRTDREGRTTASAWEEVLLERNFVKSGIGPGLTPDLKVSMRLVNLDGTTRTKTRELTPSMYSLFSASSCPAYTAQTVEQRRITREPYQSFSTSTLPMNNWLEVNYISARQSFLQELLKKREKKQRDVDGIKELIRTEQQQCFVQSVDVTTTTARAVFHISVDQQVYGPFQKVQIVPTGKTFPIKTFVPV